MPSSLFHPRFEIQNAWLFPRPWLT
uniref:Uncharacterized protein n=1 Tax=Rhizophora mucronata TaxID=61149 RepID=A0A2P2QK19_RHIMU